MAVDTYRFKSLVLLVFGFAAIMALMIVTARDGVGQLGHAKDRIDDIVMVHHEKTRLIDVMQRANRERIISLQNMIVSDDFFEIDEQALFNMEMANSFLLARRSLEAMATGPAESMMLANLRSAASRAAPVNDEIRTMLWNDEPGARARATELLMTEFRPAQDRIYAVFDRLGVFYEQENRDAVRRIGIAHETAERDTGQMVAVFLLISLLVAAMVISTILRHERQINRHRTQLESLVEERTRELMLITEEATAAREQAEQANQAKSNFMANISHELRTPLNAVLGFSETMMVQALGPIPERYREYSGHIHGSARHLLSMIEQLLDLARIEAGRLDLIEERVDVCPVLGDVIGLVQSANDRAPEDFRLTPGTPGVTVHADLRLVKQTLINVIGNAAKFSEPGTAIDIGARTTASGLEITVRDHGIGIGPEEIARLFQPYERSFTRAARQRQGTGLGLPIARSMMEAHGGSLTLRSVPGEGTTVTLCLPRARLVEDRAVA